MAANSGMIQNARSLRNWKWRKSVNGFATSAERTDKTGLSFVYHHHYTTYYCYLLLVQMAACI